VTLFSKSWVVALALGLLAGAARADSKTGTRQVGDSCADDDECVLGTICNRVGPSAPSTDPGEPGARKQICEFLPKGKRVPPFYFHQPGEVGHRHVPIGLYFSTWDREEKTRVQFPFFAQHHDYVEQTKTSIIPPIAAWYTSWREKGKEGESVGWLPFFYWRHRGPERTLALPLLLTGFRTDSKAGFAEASVLLLGYYKKEPGATTRVLAPLYFDFQRGEQRRVVAPLTYFYRDKTHSTSVIFPLVWHFSDSATGMNHVTIFPIFDYHSANHGRRQRIISLLFGWERNDDDQRRQLVLLTPPFYHRRDTVRDVDALPPIFFRWRIHAERSTTTLVGPFYHSTDPDGTTATLFPLWWYFSDKKTGSQSHLLFPVAGWFTRPHLGKQSGFIGPLYGWKSRNGWGLGLAPLIYGGRSGDKIYAMLLPLFGHSHDRVTGESTTVVGPGYAHIDPKGKGFDAGLVPLLFFGKHQTPEGSSNYAVIPGVLFHKQSPDGGQTNIVGPIFHTSDKTGWSAGLAPIAFFGKHGGKEHQVILPPLFIRTVDRDAKKESLLAGPFFHRRDGDETVDSLFPLFYLKRAPEHSLLLTPLGGFKRDGEKQTTIVLTYGQISDPKRERYTRFLFPLFIQHRQPGLRVAVVFPLFWAIEDGKERDTAFFPFYWRVRSPTMALDAIFPLMLHMKTKVADTTIVGPFWHRQRADGGRSTGLFPLFASGKIVEADGRATSYFGMPGVYWSKNETLGTRNFVLGPFFDHRTPDGYTSGLIPLGFFWRRGTVSKAFILPLLFYRKADTATDSSLNVLGPLYFGHDGQSKKFGLAPFLFVKTGPGDGTARVTFFPLFHFEKKLLGSVLITPLGGWSTYPGGIRAFFTLFYIRRDPQVSSTAFWPIIYFGKDRADDTETRLVFPLYFHRRFQSQKTLDLYTPLVWNFHTVERRVVLGLPLFFDSHWYGESRATGLLPLFIRYRSEVSKSVQWFFPPLLSWGRTRHGGDDPGTDAVVFPLVWHFGGKINSTTVAFPVWWDFKRGTTRTQVFMPGIPVYVRWERADAIRYLVFNVYVRKGIAENKGSWFVDIIPLVNFGRPRKNDITWKILEGLINYSHLGRNRILHLFWFWDIPLEPAHPSSLGWFTNTPPAGRTSLF